MIEKEIEELIHKHYSNSEYGDRIVRGFSRAIEQIGMHYTGLEAHIFESVDDAWDKLLSDIQCKTDMERGLYDKDEISTLLLEPVITYAIIENIEKRGYNQAQIDFMAAHDISHPKVEHVLDSSKTLKEVTENNIMHEAKVNHYAITHGFEEEFFEYLNKFLDPDIKDEEDLIDIKILLQTCYLLESDSSFNTHQQVLDDAVSTFLSRLHT